MDDSKRRNAASPSRTRRLTQFSRDHQVSSLVRRPRELQEVEDLIEQPDRLQRENERLRHPMRLRHRLQRRLSIPSKSFTALMTPPISTSHTGGQVTVTLDSVQTILYVMLITTWTSIPKWRSFSSETTKPGRQQIGLNLERKTASFELLC